MGELIPPGVEGRPVGTRAVRPEPIPPDLLRDSVMREAFARRDIGTVYLKLNHRGVSQRRIAALTGQSQSEVSEIIAGRKVISTEVLARIADGLGVPRSWLGLADGDEPPAVRNTPPPEETAVDVSGLTPTMRLVELPPLSRSAGYLAPVGSRVVPDGSG